MIIQYIAVLVLSSHYAVAQVQEFCIPDCQPIGPNIVEGLKVVDPTSCYHYYVCSNPQYDSSDLRPSDVPIKCEEGTYFVKNPGVPEKPGCYPIPSEGLSGKCDHLCNPCLVKCKIKGSLVPDPYDCKRFYHCEHVGHPVSYTCADEEIFDFQTQECGPVGNTTRCFDFCDPCKNYCVEEGRISNPYDCRSYFHCVPHNGLAIFHCAQNEVFNPDTLFCEDDEGEGCTAVCGEPDPDEPDDSSATTSSCGWSIMSTVLSYLFSRFYRDHL